MKKIKVLVSVLFVSGMLAVFAGCDHGNVNNHPEDVPQNLNPNDDPQTDPSSNPSSDPSKDPMTGYQYAGKKKPSEKKAVGDIVYNDGSATNILSKDPHIGEDRILDTDYKAATTGDAEGKAVAYIFYADANVALGIGLVPERTVWDGIEARAAQYQSKYYNSSDFIQSKIVPASLQSGWKVPTEADLNKMLENIQCIADVFAYKTGNSFFNSTYQEKSEYENIWSSAEGENGKVKCLQYKRPDYTSNGDKKIGLVDKTATRVIFIPVHEF